MKKLNKILLLFAVMLCLTGIGGLEVKAAGNVQKLEANRTYSTTLTGKTKHTFRYDYTMLNSYEAKSVNLYVDGQLKKVILDSEVFRADVCLCKIGPKRTLISVVGITDNDYSAYIQIYEYKKGKLKKLEDLGKSTRNVYGTSGKLLSGWARGEVKRAGNQRIVYMWTETRRTTGIVMMNIPYKVQGRKLIRQGTSYALYRYPNQKVSLTANRTIVTYTKAGGSQISFLVDRGEKVQVTKFTKKNGQVYIQIKNADGMIGWYEDLDSQGAYFEDAFFAG